MRKSGFEEIENVLVEDLRNCSRNRSHDHRDETCKKGTHGEVEIEIARKEDLASERTLGKKMSSRIDGSVVSNGLEVDRPLSLSASPPMTRKREEGGQSRDASIFRLHERTSRKKKKDEPKVRVET